MEVISVINRKGGVGKTTISTNLAAALAEYCGMRVLFIDNDSQANASSWFNATSYDATITNIFLDGAKAEDCIIPTRFTHEFFVQKYADQHRPYQFEQGHVDLIPADPGLDEVTPTLVLRQKQDKLNNNSALGKEDVLRKALEGVQDKYDICIIDNPPRSEEANTFNALVASDEIIIITTSDAFGMSGLYQMLAKIEKAKVHNPRLILRGVLLNKYSKDNGSPLIEELKSKNIPVFKNHIRLTKARVDRSTLEKKTIWEVSPRCGFALDISKFIEEFVNPEEA